MPRLSPLRPHALLFALYPVLFLYSRNMAELAPSVLVVPLLVALAATIVASLALTKLFGNEIKGGVMVSWLLLLFFSYGHVFNRVGGGVWLHHRQLMPVWVLLGAAGIFGILRARRPPARLDRTLTVVAAVAMLAVVASIALELARSREAGPIPELDAAQTVPDSTRARPDIYYIVLDGYANDANLRELYGFDNHGFVEGLQRRGFFVAHHSRSNYSTTLNSTAATLNMDYLDRLTSLIGTTSDRYEVFYSLILHDRVLRLLEARGYTCVKINTPPEFFYHDFSFMLLGTTFAAYWVTNEHYRSTTLSVFRRLDDFVPSGGPTFLYTHIVCPHPPYVFGPSGGPVSLQEKSRFMDRSALKHAYLDQMEYVNSRVLSLVDSIRTRSRRPPIIILQGDHGPANLGRMDRPDAILLKERMGILNAYLLPDAGGAGLYDSISPVNTFRLIFRNYFGLRFEPLADRSYFNLPGRPFQFITVSDSSAARGAVAGRRAL